MVMSTFGMGRRATKNRLLSLTGIGLVFALGCSQAQAQTPPSADAATVDEVVVTGTRIRGLEQPVGSSIVEVGREEIESLSATNFTDVLSQITVVNSFNTQPRISDVGSSASTAPGLRGLPASATIFLLNGNRMVGDSPLSTSPDPSSIPASAIERVEIVPDGNSAIYGSDAIGGVINIITRKDFDGFEMSGRYGSGDDYDSYDLSAIGGFRWDGGSAMLSAAYLGNDHLKNSDRDFFGQDKSAVGGADNRDTNCFPSNVSVAGVSYAPPAYAPGQVRCSNLGDADMISKSSRISILGAAEHRPGDRLRLFGDIKYTDTENEQNRPYPTSPITVADTNPFFQAPPGTGATVADVAYNLAGIFTANPQYTYDTRSAKLTAGADWNLNDNWLLSLTGTYGWSESNANNPGFNAGALGAAAAGTTAGTALDPFGSGTSASVIAAIADWRQRFDAEQELYEAVLQIDGTLFSLPGGDVKVALGSSFRNETYDAATVLGPQVSAVPATASADVDITSLFGEILIPIVGPDNGIPLMRSFEFSAAVRYDDYSNFGDTTNPKFGLTWELFEGFKLRGSMGESFHAPSLADTQGSDAKALFIPGFPLVAPGQTPPADSIALAGSNPDLKPETADTYSFGLDYRPAQLVGLALSATYYNVEFKGQIGSPIMFFPFPLFIDPVLANAYIISNPTPEQLDAAICCVPHEGFPAVLPPIGQIIDLRRYNLSETNTSGVDFQANYSLDSGWHFGLSGTRTLEYEIRATSTSPPTDSFSPGNAGIKWRLRGQIDWRGERASAGIAYNFTDDYTLSYTTAAGPPAVQEVDSYGVANGYASYRLPFSTLGADVTVSLNVDNILDEDPPLVLGSLNGFDVNRTNPIGRMYWAGFALRW